ncbi:MAG: hypothetical protein CMN76_08355 [Spirochaetaceae bacterium]|nr:hypothetical protein [Spirochaetaceae bacterium]
MCDCRELRCNSPPVTIQLPWYFPGAATRFLIPLARAGIPTPLRSRSGTRTSVYPGAEFEILSYPITLFLF